MWFSVRMALPGLVFFASSAATQSPPAALNGERACDIDVPVDTVVDAMPLDASQWLLLMEPRNKLSVLECVERTRIGRIRADSGRSSAATRWLLTAWHDTALAVDLRTGQVQVAATTGTRMSSRRAPVLGSTGRFLGWRSDGRALTVEASGFALSRIGRPMRFWPYAETLSVVLTDTWSSARTRHVGPTYGTFRSCARGDDEPWWSIREHLCRVSLSLRGAGGDGTRRLACCRARQSISCRLD